MVFCSESEKFASAVLRLTYLSRSNGWNHRIVLVVVVVFRHSMTPHCVRLVVEYPSAHMVLSVQSVLFVLLVSAERSNEPVLVRLQNSRSYLRLSQRPRCLEHSMHRPAPTTSQFGSTYDQFSTAGCEPVLFILVPVPDTSFCCVRDPPGTGLSH